MLADFLSMYHAMVGLIPLKICKLMTHKSSNTEIKTKNEKYDPTFDNNLEIPEICYTYFETTLFYLNFKFLQVISSAFQCSPTSNRFHNVVSLSFTYKLLRLDTICIRVKSIKARISIENREFNHESIFR